MGGDFDQPFPMESKVDSDQDDKDVGDPGVDIAPLVSVQSVQGEPASTLATREKSEVEEKPGANQEAGRQVKRKIECAADHVFHGGTGKVSDYQGIGRQKHQKKACP